jgi:hypothetical protein
MITIASKDNITTKFTPSKSRKINKIPSANQLDIPLSIPPWEKKMPGNKKKQLTITIKLEATPSRPL